MGAAVGAGLGFLLSRMFADEPTAGAVIRLARDRAVKRGRRQASDVADRIQGAGRQARDTFDDLLKREISSLRKVARRQRRRLGI